MQKIYNITTKIYKNKYNNLKNNMMKIIYMMMIQIVEINIYIIMIKIKIKIKIKNNIISINV